MCFVSIKMFARFEANICFRFHFIPFKCQKCPKCNIKSVTFFVQVYFSKLHVLNNFLFEVCCKFLHKIYTTVTEQ